MNLVDLYLGKQWVPWVIGNIPTDKVGTIHCADEECLDLLENQGFSIDQRHVSRFAIAVHWQGIFKTLEIEKYENLLNIHPGLIPKSRGTFPVFWDLLNYERIGVSVHQVTSILDVGPYLFRQQISYDVEDGMTIVSSRVRELEEQLFSKTLEILNFGTLNLSSIDTEEIGRERKRKDFIQLRDFGPPSPPTFEQKKRLRLAFEHPDFEIPSWLKE